ncbi:1,2-dihydroxy-3-keto-5-methylthiopentene dioxygenase [Azospirillum thermophilum]|uniref:Acireductone dioxygenase n=1 Tax=Azospirillum thermophilum TaxID=2202148 RepID=A0A2S2CR33_9PROT|nr:cupin domain-containing protein [Azospirillum thermophilum]AWK86885.1 acireductone dioxygenase [Azospirillum thermophilum]
MAHLTVYDDYNPAQPCLATADRAVLAGHLALAGILFEQWSAERPLPEEAGDEAVLAAYADAVAALRRDRGFRSVDVVRVPRGIAGAAALRARFTFEHTHDEDEARFFVEGSGAFYLHVDRKVFRVVCEAGDLLNVPAGTRHWFDMGPDPAFTAIRFFTRPDGWVAQATGSPIAGLFPAYGPQPLPA